jgi:hypothetical protein
MMDPHPGQYLTDSSVVWLITIAGWPIIRACIYSSFCRGKLLTSHAMPQLGQHMKTLSGQSNLPVSTKNQDPNEQEFLQVFAVAIEQSAH